MIYLRGLFVVKSISEQTLILNLENLPAGVDLLVAKTAQGEERKLVVKG